MAQRRMIHLKVSESNEFYKLSHSAQALYLHLNQNADDEGVVNNSETIMAALKVKRVTLNELLEKNFIICIDSKDILVIKHWYLGNTIQKDRYTQSTYHEDIYKYLEVGKDKVYRLRNGYKLETKCIQNGNKMYTQYSIVKDSIEEISIEKDSSIIKEKEINNNAPEVLKDDEDLNLVSSDEEDEDREFDYSKIPDRWDFEHTSKAVNLHVKKISGQELTDDQEKYLEAYKKVSGMGSTSKEDDITESDDDLPF